MPQNTTVATHLYLLYGRLLSSNTTLLPPASSADCGETRVTEGNREKGWEGRRRNSQISGGGWRWSAKRRRNHRCYFQVFLLNFVVSKERKTYTCSNFVIISRSPMTIYAIYSIYEEATGVFVVGSELHHAAASTVNTVQ